MVSGHRPRGYCGPLHGPPRHHPLHRLARDCGYSVEVGVVVGQDHSGALGGRLDDQVRNRHAEPAAQGQQSLNLDDGLLGAVFPNLGLSERATVLSWIEDGPSLDDRFDGDEENPPQDPAPLAGSSSCVDPPGSGRRMAMSLRADRRRGRRTRTPRLRLPILAHARHLHTLAIIAHGLRKPADPPHDSASDAAYPPRTGEEPTGSHSIHDRFPATAGIYGQSMFKTEEKN